jgi:hypothetical protein
MLLRALAKDVAMDASDPQAMRSDVAAEQRGGDPDQAMASEPPGAEASLAEARFWRDAYEEILHMEVQVMARVDELMSRATPAVRREVEMSNVPVIAAQVDRFRHRHNFWTDRVAELTPGTAAGHPDPTN